MSVIYNLAAEEPSVFFKEHGQYYVLGIYCYDKSIEEMQNNANTISISFEQTDAQGNILRDGNSFEIDLNTGTWQDVADIKAADNKLIVEFIRHLGSKEKQWFYELYQDTRKSLSGQ